MATPIFSRWSQQDVSKVEQETVYKVHGTHIPRDNHEGCEAVPMAPLRQPAWGPGSTNNSEWCNESQEKTMTIFGDVLSNM